MSDDQAVVNTLKEYAGTAGCPGGLIKLSPIAKAMKELGLSKYVPVFESAVFSIYNGKNGGKGLSLSVFVPEVLPFLADKYKEREGAKCKKSKEEIIQECVDCLKKGKPKASGPSVKGTAAAATDRLTNAAGYTGSHKERFDAEGKGKGAAGRTDKAENSGYVGNYKGAGTYDKKH